MSQYYYYSLYNERARFARTLLGGLLHAGGYNLEVLVTCVFEFSAVAHAHAC